MLNVAQADARVHRILSILNITRSFNLPNPSSFVFHAYQLPAARGRVSLEFSEKPHSDKAESPTGWQTTARRGCANSRSPNDNPPPPPNNLKWIDIFSQLQPQRQRAGSEAKLLRLSSVAASPSSQTPRSLALRIVQPSTLGLKHVEIDKPSEGRGTSPVPSSLSRISKFMPRMILFRTVMKDELCYTAIITGTCVLVAILSIIGLNLQNGLTVNGWILLNWWCGEMKEMPSFSILPRGIQLSAQTKQPLKLIAEVGADGHGRLLAWHPTVVNGKALRLPRKSRMLQTIRLRTRVIRDSLNTLGARSCRCSRAKDSFADLFCGALTREPLQSDQVLLPSVGDDFPTSGRTTPVVPRDESDGTLQDLQNTIWCEPRVVRARDNQIDPVSKI
ncbi:hypothetical protein IMY05_C4401001800 [Salix suchowensis]|nr:hypothetical protein IMY05_C4401001800 [Salix suchowensis]